MRTWSYQLIEFFDLDMRIWATSPPGPWWGLLQGPGTIHDSAPGTFNPGVRNGPQARPGAKPSGSPFYADIPDRPRRVAAWGLPSQRPCRQSLTFLFQFCQI
jgi:hypothetical protein